MDDADAELLQQAMEFAAYHDHKSLWTLLARQRSDIRRIRRDSRVSCTVTSLWRETGLVHEVQLETMGRPPMHRRSLLDGTQAKQRERERKREMATRLSCSSLEARVAGAATAAALLAICLPMPELRAAVVAFLEDDLEWRSLVVAARYGQLALLRMLHGAASDQLVSSSDAMDMSAGAGHLPVVQWLHAQRDEGCSTSAMDAAASNGHLRIVQWLHDHRREGCTAQAMDGAATNGHVAVLQWLSVHRDEGCSHAALQGASINGRVDVLMWLWLQQPALFDGVAVRTAMQGAALRGQLTVLQWFSRTLESAIWTKEDFNTLATLAQAAGHPAVVQWIRKTQQNTGNEAAHDAADRLSDWLQQLWQRVW